MYMMILLREYSVSYRILFAGGGGGTFPNDIMYTKC